MPFLAQCKIQPCNTPLISTGDLFLCDKSNRPVLNFWPFPGVSPAVGQFENYRALAGGEWKINFSHLPWLSFRLTEWIIHGFCRELSYVYYILKYMRPTKNRIVICPNMAIWLKLTGQWSCDFTWKMRIWVLSSEWIALFCLVISMAGFPKI